MTLLARIASLKDRWIEELNLRRYGPPQHLWTLPELGVKWIFVELTNHCNMHCRFCPSDSLQRPRQLMKFPLFRRVIDELALLKPSHPISLHVLGEPLLHPEFFKCLDYCAERKLRVYLFSNGLITERKIEEIGRRDNVDALILSLQTPTPESFALRGLKITFEKYWHSLLNVVTHVVDHELTSKIRVEIHLANTRDLPLKDWSILGESAEARRVMREMAREIKRIGLRHRGEPDDPEALERMLDEDFEKIPENILELREWEYWGYEVLPNVFLRFKYFSTFGAPEALLPGSVTIEQRQDPALCEMAQTNLCVLADGTITLCCIDSEGETRIGHMRHRGIYKALCSEKRADLKKDVTSLEVCRRCLGAIKPRA